ncbi:MAG: peptidylprolyl isomerase [Armatimonadetes bacterium]|nr:peptidylprolyl isomerase [Armatimonadota bacterium]
MTVTDEELDKEVQKLYKETADRQFAGLSPSDRARYEKQLQGYLEEREDEIRNSLLVKKWEDSLKNQVKVDDPKTKPEDIEVRARHILIPVKDPKAPPPPKNAPANTIPLPDAEAKAKAEKVLKEAKQPKADFAALAKKYSSDTGSAERGGDLDWFGKGQMVPEFDKTVYSMKPGEIAGPVKTQFGYHIIKLEDRRIGDAVKARLVDEHMKKARKTATVKVNDEVLEGMRLLNEAEQVADKPKERDRLHREALKHFEAARKEDQGNPGIVAMVGEVKKRLYNYGDKKDKKLRDEAIKELETAVKLTPAPRLRTDLAMLYEDAGKRQEALDQLKKASENAFTDKSVRYELKSGFERLGEKQLAQEQQKLLEMDMQQMQQGNFNFPGGAPGGAPVPVTPGG